MVEMGIEDRQARPADSMGNGGNLGGIAVTLVPPDDEPNPNNPYDRLPPGERKIRIIELCACIHRQVPRRSDEAGQEGEE